MIYFTGLARSCIIQPLKEIILKAIHKVALVWALLCSATVHATVVGKQHSVKPTSKNVECVANAVYYEAKSEPLIGKAAVAWVIVNRVKHGFAPDPCSVVYQSRSTKAGKKSCEFSWVCNKKRIPIDKRGEQYQESVAVAKDVLNFNKYSGIVSTNTLFFHSKQVRPRWKMRVAKVIGNHVFYSVRTT